MSRSWTVSPHGVPKKGRKPVAEDCRRKFTSRDLIQLADDEDSFNHRIQIRTTVEEAR